MLFSVVFNRPSKCGDVTVGNAEKSRPGPRGPKSRGNGRSSGRNVDSTGVHSYRRIMLRVGDPSLEKKKRRFIFLVKVGTYPRKTHHWGQIKKAVRYFISIVFLSTLVLGGAQVGMRGRRRRGGQKASEIKSNTNI